jgi:hypothetical protein
VQGNCQEKIVDLVILDQVMWNWFITSFVSFLWVIYWAKFFSDLYLDKSLGQYMDPRRHLQIAIIFWCHIRKLSIWNMLHRTYTLTHVNCDTCIHIRHMCIQMICVHIIHIWFSF